MSERTITNLLALDGRIVVYLRGGNLPKIFLKNASAEGFTFRDGADPQSRQIEDMYAVHHDFTINYMGFIGHMAFYEGFSNSNLVRVDYGKYIAGRDDYIITDRSQL